MVRWLLVLGLLVVGCGLGGPTVYPGDRVEERECRWCAGSGLAGPLEEGGPSNPGGACPGCRGAKRLKVVVPGPNHPAVVRGTVRDSRAMGELGSPEAMALLAMQEARSPGPVRGAVAAKVVFDGPDRIEHQVPASGKIRTMLKPGHYRVTVSAPGFQDVHEEIEVAPRREPLWNERARLITEEQEADTTYVNFFLRP